MSDLRAHLRITADAKDVAREAANVERSMGKVGQSGRQAKAGLDQAAAGADHFERAASGAGLQAKLLGTALAGFGLREFVGGISDAALKVQGFNTGLGAVAGGARGAAAEQGFLRAEAERLGLVVQDQVDGFMGLAGATNGTRLAGAQTREIWLGLVEAGTALNRSAEQQKRAMEAVSQIASKGVVSMEELRGQLSEAIPGAMQIAARAMGMTTAELNKLVGDGKVASEDFLPKFAAQLRREFGPALDEAMTTPLGRARRELAQTKTAMFDLQGAVGGEFLAAATAGLEAFNDELSSPETLAAARQLGAAMGEAAALAGQGAAFLVEHVDAVVFALQAMTGVAAARWLSGFTVEIRKAALAAQEKAAAQLAAAQAGNAEAQANLKSATTGVAYAQRAEVAAAAARKLEQAQRSGAAAMIGVRGAAGSLIGFLGGPWGIAFTAATLGVAFLSGKMLQAEQDAATLQRGLDILDQRSRAADDASRTLASGLDIATAASRTAAAAARDHANALSEVERASINAALAVARQNVEAARARTTDSTPELWKINPESPTAGADLLALQDQARKDLARAEMIYEKALEESNRANQTGSRVSRGVGGERDRLRRDAATDVDQGAAATVAADTAVADSKDKRAKKTDEVREAEQRLARAGELNAKLQIDTDLQRQRAEAALQGEEALERLRVKEAGVQAMQQLGVTSLEKLTGAQRKAVEEAMASAEAYERQSIATEKANRVANTVRDLDRRLVVEKERTKAIAGGTQAMVKFAQAEAVRQEVERTGATLTAEQIKQIETKVALLLEAQSANDNAEAVRNQREELELLVLTNREREIEIRARELARRLQQANLDLTDEEAKARARIVAMQDYDAEERAREIGNLREDLRRAFIESGELGFDQIADYATRQLRKAVYDALLAEPIDILINATIGGLNGLTGVPGQGGGLLGSLLGTAVPGVGTLGSLFSGAAMGMAAGQSMGLGTGKVGTDTLLSLGGAGLGGALAGSMAGGYIGAGVANAALGLGASTAMAGSLGVMLSSAAVLGPIAAIAALAIGTMFKDEKRPYARSDIGVVNGQFSVTGGDQLDQGPLDKTNQAAQQIVQSLNAAADLFKLDMTKLSGNVGSFGYVEGKNTGALGQGWFGGGGGGFSGAEFSGSKDPEKLAADIVKATILRAIEAGASDLSEAEKNVVRQAASLEEAANKIAAGRSISQSIEDALLQLMNPAEFERKQALAAIEANYKAMKAQADELIAAGLVSGDILTKLDQVKDLQVAEAMRRLGAAADDAANRLKQGNDFKTEVNEAILKIVDPTAYQLSKGTREINAAIEEMRTRAQGLIASGAVGPEVLGQIEALRQLQLGELVKEVDQTAAAFEQNRKALRAWLDGLSSSPSAELSAQGQKEQAQADYDRILRQARGGDTDARNAITGYADRLFAADRMATDDAQARLALFNQVRADIEGLTRASAPGVSGVMAEQLKALGLPLDKLVELTGLGQTANDDILGALTSTLAVDMINVPALREVYAEVSKAETDRIVAAIDLLRADLAAAMAANDTNALHTALDGLSNRLAGLEGATWKQTDVLGEMGRDWRSVGAMARARA
ncbi:tape measure protein [Phenylobacterium sp. 58.2.17]|uniref:tape measure protein n=1 Tax=Phenylobacterium sp. 58.2.17 TaxID=2969306 RepID=UPI002264F254|nr:tape measure protein [Phenylobacterium sp. 58.2.17]MCX7586537.1 tape measure protein [Phenylobacterium sp. 58.2.17]